MPIKELKEFHMASTARFNILEGGYSDMINHLRRAFTAKSDNTVEIELKLTTSNEPVLPLTFRTKDQYLIAIHGTPISDANQHYSKMPTPNILTFGQINDALHHKGTASRGPDAMRLRILAFITSEAARFHVVSRNVSQLIREKNDSYAMDFKEADFLIKNYEKARRVAGLPAGRFEALADPYVHIARMQEFARHGNVTSDDKTLARTDVLNKLLSPARR